MNAEKPPLQGSDMPPKKKRPYLVAFALFFVLLMLLPLLFNPGGIAAMKVKEFLGGRSDVSVKSSPSCKLWLGMVDHFTVTAEDVDRFQIPLKSMSISAQDIRIDVGRLLKKEGPYCIRTARATGSVEIDEDSLAGILSRKIPAFTQLEVRLLPDTVQLTLRTRFISTITLKGNLTVRDSREIYLELPELGTDAFTFKEKSRLQILSLLNPILDVEGINAAGALLKNLSETEREKWDIKVTGLDVGTGSLKISFTADKRE